jgi:hypothetical protein
MDCGRDPALGIERPTESSDQGQLDFPIPLATILLDLLGDQEMNIPKDKGGQTVWNASSTEATSFVGLASADLTELAKKVSEAVKGDVDERVRPYQTPVTMETLRAPVP